MLTPYRVFAGCGLRHRNRKHIPFGCPRGRAAASLPGTGFHSAIRNRLPADPELPLGPSVDDALGDPRRIRSCHSMGLCDAVDYGIPSHYAAGCVASRTVLAPRRFDRSMLTSSNQVNRSIERFEGDNAG